MRWTRCGIIKQHLQRYTPFRGRPRKTLHELKLLFDAYLKALIRRKSRRHSFLGRQASGPSFSSSLLQNALLNPDNELTKPSTESLQFVRDLLKSQSLVAEFRSPMSIREATTLCLFASGEQQLLELKRMLQHIAAVASIHTDWTAVRAQILWLRSWSNDVSSGPRRSEEKSRGALLWQLSPQMVDTEILRTMLESKAFRSRFRNIWRLRKHHSARQKPNRSSSKPSWRRMTMLATEPYKRRYAASSRNAFDF